MDKSCLTCRKYFGCDKKKKGTVGYFCDSYKKLKANTSLLDLDSSIEYEDRPSGVIVPSEDARFSELENYVESVLSTPTGIPRDLKVDDRDLKEFPNFYKFASDPQGLGLKLFSRQMMMGVFLFAEYCPRCSDPEFVGRRRLEDIPLKMPASELPEHVKFLKNGVCKKCGATRSDLFRAKDLNPYNELAACIGQRGGKSTSVSTFFCYLLHRYMKLQRPTEVFGLLPNTTLSATFVALTADRAARLLWNPVHDLILQSPWFQEYHKLLDHYGEKRGEELYKFMDTFVHYRHRQLLVHPSGPNKRTLRGDTRFATAIDEIGWFPVDASEDAVKMNADEVYKALDRSLLTLRTSARKLIRGGYPQILSAYAFNISSPSSQRDKIMTLVKTNRHSRFMFTVHLPTWKFNPFVSKKDLKKEYDEDPIKAERDYGANPPMADAPFIENAEMVKAAFRKERSNRIVYKYCDEKDRFGSVHRFAKIESIMAASALHPSILTVDAGETNNSFAIAVMHRERASLGSRDYRQVLDVAVEVSPEKERIPINMTELALNMIYPLIKAFNVKVFAADRWQSSKQITDIQKDFPDVVGGTHSLSYEDFLLFRSVMEAGLLEFGRLEMSPKEFTKLKMQDYPNLFRYKPMSHLYFQCITVNDRKTQVTKGSGGLTDDLFRAVALGSAYLSDEEFCNEYLNSEPVTNKAKGIGSIMSRGGGIASFDPSNLNNPQTGQGGGIISISGRGDITRSPALTNIFVPTKR